MHACSLRLAHAYAPTRGACMHACAWRMRVHSSREGTLPVSQTSGRLTTQSEKTSDSAAPISASLPRWLDTSTCLHVCSP